MHNKVKSSYLVGELPLCVPRIILRYNPTFYVDSRLRCDLVANILTFLKFFTLSIVTTFMITWSWKSHLFLTLSSRISLANRFTNVFFTSLLTIIFLIKSILFITILSAVSNWATYRNLLIALLVKSKSKIILCHIRVLLILCHFRAFLR